MVLSFSHIFPEVLDGQRGTYTLLEIKKGLVLDGYNVNGEQVRHALREIRRRPDQRSIVEPVRKSGRLHEYSAGAACLIARTVVCGRLPERPNTFTLAEFGLALCDLGIAVDIESLGEMMRQVRTRNILAQNLKQSLFSHLNDRLGAEISANMPPASLQPPHEGTAAIALIAPALHNEQRSTATNAAANTPGKSPGTRLNPSSELPRGLAPRNG